MAIRDPYVRKDCVHYPNPEKRDQWECSAGKPVCQCHGRHLAIDGGCVYRKAKAKAKAKGKK